MRRDHGPSYLLRCRVAAFESMDQFGNTTVPGESDDASRLEDVILCFRKLQNAAAFALAGSGYAVAAVNARSEPGRDDRSDTVGVNANGAGGGRRPPGSPNARVVRISRQPVRGSARELADLSVAGAWRCARSPRDGDVIWQFSASLAANSLIETPR